MWRRRLPAGWVVVSVLALACEGSGTNTTGSQPNEPQVVLDLREVAAFAEDYPDVPEDPTVYGHAAAIAVHSRKRKVYEDTAARLEQLNAETPNPLLLTFRDRELDSAAKESDIIAKLEDAADAHGYPLDDEAAVLHVVEATLFRRIAADIDELISGHEAGSVPIAALEEYRASANIVLGSSHGQDIALHYVMRETDPTTPETREVP